MSVRRKRKLALGVGSAEGPLGWIGYAQAVVNQTGITGTAADLTGLSCIVTVGPNRRIRIMASVELFSATASDTVALFINEGAVILNHSISQLNSVANTGETLSSHVVLTPTAGSHTYKLAAAIAAGVGPVTLQAGATRPALILVEDLGPA